MTQRAERYTPRFASRRSARAHSAVTVLEPVESRVLMAVTPIDIEGVYNASLDQPRTYAMLQRSPTGDPLTATDPLFGIETFTVEAFYDTGASGVLISQETADALGVDRPTFNGETVYFEDVGVGGSSFFEVSEPLYISLAPYGVERDLDNLDTYPSVYTQKFGAVRAQVSAEPADEALMPLDVFGMPTMTGKVIVMDARPPSSDGLDFGVMRTYTYDPGTPYNPAEDDNDPGIPRTNFHVDLSYAHFDRFTDVTPAGAPGPSMRHNPFIGPNPLRQIDPSLPVDNTPGLTVTHGSQSFTGSWLFDTGAAASIISLHGAEAVGVQYAEGTYHTDDPLLVDDAGNPVPDQFTLQIGGVGGSFTAAGFFLDSMVLPTMEGQPIRYLRAPVLVGDISVADPDTGEAMTLDGVFGMNFLVASMFVNGTDLGDVSAGAYDWLVFDEPNGVLGLNIPFAPDPTPTVVGRNVFYNNTFLDGFDPAANAGDDDAVAIDKRALLPGETATFLNYTSASNGITGIMVDVSRLANAAGVGADDVAVKVGSSDAPATWAAAPAPAVTVRPGAGAGGSDRVTLTWGNDQVRNQWVQVTVKANADTGLAADEVFYFGNLVGETGDQVGAATVGAEDMSRTRAQLGRRVGITSPFDHARDGRIGSADLSAVRGNLFQSLQLITAPTPGAAATAAASVRQAEATFAPTATRSATSPRRRGTWDEPQLDLLGRVA
jgi:hypothetical protein